MIGGGEVAIANDTKRRNSRANSGLRPSPRGRLVKFDVLDEFFFFDESGYLFAGLVVADGLDFGDGQVVVVGAVAPFEDVAGHDGIFAAGGRAA